MCGRSVALDVKNGECTTTKNYRQIPTCIVGPVRFCVLIGTSRCSAIRVNSVFLRSQRVPRRSDGKKHTRVNVAATVSGRKKAPKNLTHTILKWAFAVPITTLNIARGALERSRARRILFRLRVSSASVCICTATAAAVVIGVCSRCAHYRIDWIHILKRKCLVVWDGKIAWSDDQTRRPN